MKKFSNVTLAAARHPRAAARFVLAFVAAVLVVLLAMMGMGVGPNGALAFAQESPSPTAEPTGPAIQLINPNDTSDPVIVDAMEPAENPKISDRYDGSDNAYHIVAVTRQAPAGAVVEAYWAPEDENEQTIGQLTLVPGTTDAWEFFWDIPSSLDEGTGELVARLYSPSGSSFEQVAEDRVTADLQHDGSFQDPDDAPAENTVEMVWPSNGGELGFHKPKGGAWRTWMNGTSSGEYAPGNQVIDGTVRVRLFYTVTPVGENPVFKDCGEADPGGRRADGTETWAGQCSLLGKDAPSQVVAVVAVATGFDRPGTSGAIAESTIESSDGHRVKPYVQDPRQMNISVEGLGGGTSASYPSGRRRLANDDCLRFRVKVTDQNDRPVQGANVDIHLEGPNDQVAFGDDEVSNASSLDSAGKPPEKKEANHSSEGRRYCSDGVTSSQTQGEHNVPGGPDLKHLESVAGTGLDGGGAGAGEWNFLIFSADPGLTKVTAWIDDETIANEGATREADSDTRTSAEPQASLTAQWLPDPMTVRISPQADSATVGTCNRYVVRVRAGAAEIRDINVDVHASGPNDELDFCDPGDGTARRAPDKPEGGDNEHTPEDEGEASHGSDSPDNPRVQHTEGETDGSGNFIFGIVSQSTGSSEIEAWVDGEKGQDDDVKGSSEIAGTATKSWAGSAQDAEVRFVNPSGYGGAGDNVSLKRDADELFHLVARVDLPDVVEGVEFFRMDGETMLADLGDATRVGTTDTWELYTSALPDGEYTLRAQIINTNKREDRAVTVDSTMETAELSRPANAAGAPFSGGETNIAGVASAGAVGVEFFYTKTDARETRDAAQWIACGETELPTGDAPQNFEGKCALQGSDAALDVTGVAALTWACPEPVIGCELERTYQTGDAHRVYGFEANPSVSVEPAEASSDLDSCRRFELTVRDGVGRAIPNANVDVHLTGPTDGARFCDVADSSPRRAPTTGGHSPSPVDGETATHQNEGADTHHTEGEADEGGKFIFGVRSGSKGDSQIVGWADQNDNDALDTGEKSDTSVMHWGSGGGGGRGCTINGDGGNNVIRGTAGDDVICAGGGRDTIRGRGGNDVIYGGGGHDDIRGNAGNDRLIGGGGLDVLRGGHGNDVVRGKAGNDTMRGYTGKDRLMGGGGDDVIAGGRQDDYLRGNTGNDTLNGGRGRDNCRGGFGRDSVSNCER